MKSSMAMPSFKNSGLLATSTSRPVSSFSRAASFALVPTGTVLLHTTMQSWRDVRGKLLGDRPEEREIERAVGGRRSPHRQKHQPGLLGRRRASRS